MQGKQDIQWWIYISGGKLHENERISIPRGGASLAPP